MLTEIEKRRLREYVIKRYTEVGKDYKEFDTDAEKDDTLTYYENKNIFDEKLAVLLPATIPDLKKECSMPKEQVEQEYNNMLQNEIRKTEEQISLKMNCELDKIVNAPESKIIDEVFYIPTEYIKMVFKNHARGLFLCGEAGLGKSHLVKKVIAEMNLKQEDYFFISGHITPLQLYKTLFENKDKIIILDDVNILENEINLNIFKAALNDYCGDVSYHTTLKIDIPNKFLFSGKIIVLLNDEPKNSEHLKAVKSRVLHYNLNLSYQDKIKIIFEIAKNDYDGIELADRIKIASWIKDNTNISTKNLNLRLLFMCFEFLKHNKERWQELAKAYIQNDEYTTYILRGLSEQEFCEQVGCHRATYYRYKQKVLNQVALSH